MIDVDHRLELDGLRLRVEDLGSGKPLLLLNGLGASLEMLTAVRDSLAATRRVISFDVPGVGESDQWRRPVVMADYVDLIIAVLDRLEIRRLDIVGYSWGGVLAQAFAIHRPQRVDRLVLISTGTGATTIPGHPLAPLMLTTHARYLFPRFLKAAAPMLYGGDIRQSRSDNGPFEESWTAHPPRAGGYLGQLSALWGYTSLPSLRSLPHRTLILTGTDDPIAHHANTRLMGRLIRRSTVEIIPEAGHLLPVTRPVETAETVGYFLDEQDDAHTTF